MLDSARLVQHDACARALSQVLAQLGVVYSIPFPNMYGHLLRWCGMLTFDLPEILPVGCIVSLSFYKALLFRTLLLPALGLLFMALRVLKVSQRATKLFGTLLFVILFLIVGF